MLQTLTQKLSGLSIYVKLALAVLAYQAVFITCLEAFVYSKHNEIVSILAQNETNATNGTNATIETYANARSMPVYHVLFIIAQFFQLGIYVDAIYNQNTIQIIALTLFEFGILIYSVIQVFQSAQILKNISISKQITILPYEITIIVLISILATGFAYLAYKLYQEFGWSIYKKIGADMAMRDRYKMYQIFIMLLKFDLFFFVGLSAQILVLVIFISNGQADQIAGHIVMSSVISTSMLMAAFLGVKKENKLMMYLFMVGCVGTEVYFTIKLVDISKQPQKYSGTRIFATFFVCICMILGVVTLIISALCLRNFDKGLKYHLSRDCNNENETGDQFPPGNNGFNLESVRGTIKRWSID
ncbi:5078_t:CDS:10 [Paraglomus occultum]|uniref:5078_t:CDS:1 n=1 Tax=Paraglomus occultum TaxID=144539 RepID=A0A9N9BGP8_9GLOM|nr:5078_t:CDS:10 [Paraglomus occultum]